MAREFKGNACDFDVIGVAVRVMRIATGEESGNCGRDLELDGEEAATDGPIDQLQKGSHRWAHRSALKSWPPKVGSSISRKKAPNIPK